MDRRARAAGRSCVRRCRSPSARSSRFASRTSARIATSPGSCASTSPRSRPPRRSAAAQTRRRGAGSRALTFRPGRAARGRLLLRHRHRGKLHAGVPDGAAGVADRARARAACASRVARTTAARRPSISWRAASCRCWRAWAPTCSSSSRAHGFYPRGGGEIRARIAPAARLGALNLHEARRARCAATRRPTWPRFPRMSRSASSRSSAAGLCWPQEQLLLRALPNDVGPGNAVTITLEHENVTEVFTGFGEKGRARRNRGGNAADEARAYLVGACARGRAPRRSVAVAHGPGRRAAFSSPRASRRICVRTPR